MDAVFKLLHVEVARKATDRKKKKGLEAVRGGLRSRHQF